MSTKTSKIQMGRNMLKRWLENESQPISQNTLADLKGPKGKYNLHYEDCCFMERGIMPEVLWSGKRSAKTKILICWLSGTQLCVWCCIDDDVTPIL